MTPNCSIYYLFFVFLLANQPIIIPITKVPPIPQPIQRALLLLGLFDCWFELLLAILFNSSLVNSCRLYFWIILRANCSPWLLFSSCEEIVLLLLCVITNSPFLKDIFLILCFWKYWIKVLTSNSLSFRLEGLCDFQG